MRLSAWEHAELLEYFDDYVRWLKNDERTFFVKVDDENNPLFAVSVTPPADSGPHRLYSVSIIPQNWSDEQSAEYFVNVLARFTSYSLRMRLQQFLSEELKHDDDTAYAAALIMSRMVNDPMPTPEEAGVQANLDGSVAVPDIPTTEGPNERTWLLASHGGGWMKLKLAGGMIAAEVSVMHEATGGFGHSLRGYLRPRYAPAEEEFNYIVGRAIPLSEEQVEVQRALEEEAS